MHDDLTSYGALVEAIYFAGIVSVVMVMIGFGCAIYFVKRITGPVTLLTKAAVSVEKGEYDLRSIREVSDRTDELGQLSRVLQKMAREVYQREEDLKKQVKQLQIIIDRKKIDRDVAEIVSTDYFQDLRDKVKAFRKR
jgi:nitrogen fixation/metabolism regulation signal transduction histidine kinase